MSDWISANSGIRFLCWGKLKDTLTEEEAYVVEKGKSIQGIILDIEPDIDADDNVIAYKIRVQAKDSDEPVMIWTNASMLRQIDDIQKEVDLSEGDEIRLTYVKDYKAKGGKTGRDIKLELKKSK